MLFECFSSNIKILAFAFCTQLLKLLHVQSVLCCELVSDLAVESSIDASF